MSSGVIMRRSRRRECRRRARPEDLAEACDSTPDTGQRRRSATRQRTTARGERRRRFAATPCGDRAWAGPPPTPPGDEGDRPTPGRQHDRLRIEQVLDRRARRGGRSAPRSRSHLVCQLRAMKGVERSTSGTVIACMGMLRRSARRGCGADSAGIGPGACIDLLHAPGAAKPKRRNRGSSIRKCRRGRTAARRARQPRPLPGTPADPGPVRPGARR